jgi:hypothetical protein
MKNSPWMTKPLSEETGVSGEAHVVIRVGGYAPAARDALLRCFERFLRCATGVELEDLNLQGQPPGFYQVGLPEQGVHFRLQEDGTLILYEDDHVQDSYSKHLRSMSQTYQDLIAAVLVVGAPSPNLKIEVHYHF